VCQYNSGKEPGTFALKERSHVRICQIMPIILDSAPLKISKKWLIYNQKPSQKSLFPNLCVGPSFQLLDIHEYACGLKLVFALILGQNPNFEMVSNIIC